MSDATLVRCCAPTLAGMKTGSVFTCAYDRRSTLRSELARLNRELGSRGLRILPLRFRESHALVYLFRPDALARDLRRSRARDILSEAGYESTECSACIRRLICRLHSEAEFPHEIGRFWAIRRRMCGASSKTGPGTVSSSATGRSTAT